MGQLTIWWFVLAILAGFAAAIGGHLLDIVWPHKAMT